jgi:hypothetical protein
MDPYIAYIIFIIRYMERYKDIIFICTLYRDDPAALVIRSPVPE